MYWPKSGRRKWLILVSVLVGSLLVFPTVAYAFTPDTDLSAADASFWGEDEYDYSGYSVACAGDVDGDGYDDFLIGAISDDDGGGAAGQTYLLFGEPPPAVGGEVYPVNKLPILAPWIVLAVVLVAGISWLAIKRRRAQSQA